MPDLSPFLDKAMQGEVDPPTAPPVRLRTGDDREDRCLDAEELLTPEDMDALRLASRKATVLAHRFGGPPGDIGALVLAAEISRLREVLEKRHA